MVELAKVQQLLSMVCPYDPEEMTLDKHLFNDLDMDSFGMMEMIMAFEQEFDIEVPDRDLRLFNTVQDVVTYIEEKQMGGTLVRA